MPRTIPSSLETAMDSGVFQPYLKIMINETYLYTPTYFKLGPLTAEAIIEYNPDIDYETDSYFRIIRGAVINGTPVTITSIQFPVIEWKYDGRLVTLMGEVLERKSASVAADSTYQEVIEGVFADATFATDPKSPSFEGTAAWKDYAFYPAGRTVVFSEARKLFTVLNQKYLVYATENGWDGTDNDILFFVATDTRATDYTIEDVLFKNTSLDINRRLLSRDEANTITITGSSTYPLHNLGYLHSTASQPSNVQCSPTGKSSKLPVDLKRITGDKVQITRYGVSWGTMRARVTEIFDKESTPSWYQIVEGIEWYSSTEGGALPSTIEAAAPYTPLNTSEFDGILSENDNNIQAAMETIDDHTHADIQADIDNHIADTTDAHAYSSLSNKPAAEIQTNDIYRVDTPGGVSLWTGTISGTPSGASVTVSAPTSGVEGALVPTSTSQLGKMRLYNLTRGNYALISNYNTGTNAFTLTANAPSNWANGDSLTIVSQTVSGGGANWVDIEIVSGPTNKSYMFIGLHISSATAGNVTWLHPLETYNISKTIQLDQQVANALITSRIMWLLKITNNVFSLMWDGTPSKIIVREAGYLE